MPRKTADTLLVLIFLFVATPWLFSAYLSWQAGKALHNVNGVLVEAVDGIASDTGALGQNLREGGIVGQPDMRKVRARYKELRSYAALPDQVMRANNSVNLVMLDLKKEDGWEIPVGVDVSGFGSSAMVLVSNASMLVDITGAQTGQRGKIAVESPMPVDMTGLELGLLAGLKVPRKQALIIDTIYGDKAELSRFCLNAKDWMEHFGVKPPDVVAWHVHGAKNGIKLARSGGVLRLSEGQASLVELGNLDRVCRDFMKLFRS
jgi:hypothetical protein